MNESRVLPRLARALEVFREVHDTSMHAGTLTLAHDAIALAYRGDNMVVVTPAVMFDEMPELLIGFAKRFEEGTAMVVLLGVPRRAASQEKITGHTDVAGTHTRPLPGALPGYLGGIVALDHAAVELHLAIARSFDLMDARTLAAHRAATLPSHVARDDGANGNDELVSIARAMTTERNVDKLLSLILEKSRYVTSADAGSIYVLENEDKGDSRLRFKLTQNDTVAFDSREFTMPISTRSIAGSVALEKKALRIDDVYELPSQTPFRFDPSFDQRVGYLTRSMLTVPLISQRGEVIGVIQLINRKRAREATLKTRAEVDSYVVPFDQRTEDLLGLVAAQAAIALENALLYEEIRTLFEGFVHASVEAIEARDPTTSGHSRRVADLTVGLARVVSSESGGPHGSVQFTNEDLRELEYASLLHDFGKIGVKEKVLVKAKKLYEERLELLRSRFDYVIKSIEVDILRRKLSAIERRASDGELLRLDRELEERRAETEAAFDVVLAANEPTVVAAGDFARLEEIAKETFYDGRGEVRALLDRDDVVALSVKRGTLTPAEYEEISSHVSHTFNFLSRIPWGKALRRVPQIAGAHHERINGSGYPHRLRGDEIPVQSKIMSIADIFDALTAADRPYKKAMPVERALDILGFSVKDGHLDADLVRIFGEARIWERAKIPV